MTPRLRRGSDALLGISGVQLRAGPFSLERVVANASITAAKDAGTTRREKVIR
jgi:hypothetical protein